MHNLTTEEQERLAYAEGYTETAAVLARLDDAHRALGQATAELAIFEGVQAEMDDLMDERDALRADLIESAHHVGQLREELDSLFEEYKGARNLADNLQAQLDDATDAVDGLRSKVDELEQRLTGTMAEREQARDQVKTLRSALMAIESEVPAHIRQFIREVLQ
jgi:chromosome segregation ATPase